MYNYIIVGNICSGKTSLAKKMKEVGYDRVVTYTTRPPRTNEVNGDDYIFIDEFTFIDLFKKEVFAEYYYVETIEGGWYYATVIDDLYTEDLDGPGKVVVLSPYGVDTLLRKGIINKEEWKIIFLDIPTSTLRQRAEERGDNEEEVIRRITEDEAVFNGFKADLYFDQSYDLDRMIKIIKRYEK